MNVQKRSKKFYGLLALVLLSSPFLFFACQHYYSKSLAKTSVDQFCIASKILFQEKLSKDPTFSKVLTERLFNRLTSYNNETPLALVAYGQDEFALHFVKDHAVTDAHTLLFNRVKALYDDGVDIEPYEVGKHAVSLDRLQELNDLIDQTASIVLLEPEKQLLYDAADKAAGEKSKNLSPYEILKLALNPIYVDKFPNVHQAWDQLVTLSVQRAQLEADIEAESGRWYFMLLSEMLIDNKLFLDNWKLFAKKPAKALDQIEPQITYYAQLREGLKKYREFAKKPFDDYHFKSKSSKKIKQGTKKGELVLRIKSRLAIEGYWAGDMTPMWGEALTEALIEYQYNHQIVPDGVYGRGTAKSFNVTMARRVKQLRLSLQRLRESNGRWDKYYVRVNIPEMGLEVHKNMKVIKRHRVIVGNLIEKNNTPVFSDEIELVNFNPSWFVPERIIKEEMTPKFEKDEDFFTKKGYIAKINDEGKILAVRQPPGPGNALGIVKILFPNRHDVYLHDTPTKYLFKRTVRPFSHGCMRLQDASEMAIFLLEQDGSEMVDQVPSILKKRYSKDIYLKSKVPIHIEYVLASVNEEGDIVFFGDVYGNEKDDLLAMNP